MALNISSAANGGNRLPALAGEIADLHNQIERHTRAAADKALKAGAALAEAKALVAHGQWAGWLSLAGITERTAQRYMRLHRLCLNSDTVSDLGGIKAALLHMKDARLPDPGKVLLASTDGFDPDGGGILAAVWRHGNGYHVASIDFCKEWPSSTRTKHSMRADTAGVGESPIWLTLWLALEWRLKNVSFSTVCGETSVAQMLTGLEVPPVLTGSRDLMGGWFIR